MNYDEDRELTAYVLNNFPRLMSDFEHRVAFAIVGRQKLARLEVSPEHPLATRWGLIGDSEVNAALADGPEAFRRRVRDRILAESEGGVFVNRCPRCRRVVRTPQAQQCFWCGADWHEAVKGPL